MRNKIHNEEDAARDMRTHVTKVVEVVEEKKKLRTPVMMHKLAVRGHTPPVEDAAPAEPIFPSMSKSIRLHQALRTVHKTNSFDTFDAIEFENSAALSYPTLKSPPKIDPSQSINLHDSRIDDVLSRRANRGNNVDVLQQLRRSVKVQKATASDQLLLSQLEKGVIPQNFLHRSTEVCLIA